MRRIVRLMVSMVLVFMSVLAVPSCRSEKEAPISQENMENIIYDMLIIEELLYSRGDIRAQSDSSYVYLPIFEKYGYSIEDFHNSVEYYLRHIVQFVELSTSVKERLEAEQAMLDSASQPAQKKKVVIDSDTLSSAQDTSGKASVKKRRVGLEKKKLKELEERFK